MNTYLIKLNQYQVDLIQKALFFSYTKTEPTFTQEEREEVDLLMSMFDPKDLVTDHINSFIE